MEKSAISRIKVQSLREIATASLRESIITGYFRAGHQLKERDLSEKMGISTTPIKEAFRTLEYEGLITTHPRRGTFVNESVDSQLKEILLLRASVESLAARLAASKMTDETVGKVARMKAEMIACREKKDREGLIRVNEQFHTLIREACGNPMIQNILSTIRAFDSGFRKRALKFDSEMETGTEEHGGIIDAMVSRDPEEAERRMKLHITRTIQNVWTEEANSDAE